MTILTILQHPDPQLRRVAKAVTEFNEELRQQVLNIADTALNTPNTAGLAATQVGIHKRIVILTCGVEQGQYMCLINPEITWKSNTLSHVPEGCKSVDVDVADDIPRAEHIRFRAQNLKGETNEMEASGFLSTCIQHEIDHLNGKLYIDYLPAPKKRWVNLQLIQKQQQITKEVA